MNNTQPAGGGIGGLIDIVAALLAIGAGAYLLQYNSASTGDGTSWFEIIGHGMGVYFIAKGLFMMRSAWFSSRSVDHLKHLAEWARYDHHDEEQKVVAAAPELSRPKRGLWR